MKVRAFGVAAGLLLSETKVERFILCCIRYIPANGRRYAPLGATRFRSRRTGAFSHFLCARIGTYESTCPRSLFLPYLRHCAAMRIRI